MSNASDPFVELGLAPTLKMAEVKRAYFGELPRRPPHQDAEGFRRLRAAYESLTAPRGLALAWAHSVLDPERDLARWRAEWEPLLAEARERREHHAVSETALDQLLDLSGMTLAQVFERYPGVD